MPARTGQRLVLFYVIAMCCGGTLNTLTTKMQFETESVNKDGDEALFKKPWFATFNMLSAMAFVGFVDKLVRLLRPAPVLRPDASYQKMDDRNGNSKPSYWGKVLIVSVPALFDLLATAFCCMGMLYIPASIWQMLKGGAIIFCGIFSVLFLRRELYAFHWLGLITCLLGLAIVGLANVLGNSDQPSSGSVAELAFGMGLVMIGQVFQAGQVVAEEFLMKEVDLPGMVLVGWEGFWGMIMMIFVAYPVLWFVPGEDHGHTEDVVDTLVMLYNSLPLTGLFILYLFSCATFNASAVSVTSVLSATHRAMIDAFRTFFIWIIGLGVHHFDSKSRYGESWTSYSWLQLVGFFILLTGQSVYGSLIRVPMLYYPEAPCRSQEFASPGLSRMSPGAIPDTPQLKSDRWLSP